MSDGEFGGDWSAALGEAGGGLAQWRREHPWATFEEIEEARDRYLQPVLTQMTGELAAQCPAAVVRGLACPSCGAHLQSGGKRRREVLSEGGQRIPIERAYARCPACRWAGFPPR